MIIAIDQSYSGTGICYLSSDGRMETTLVKTTADMLWALRMEAILSSLSSMLDLSSIKMDNPSKVEHVVLEDYAYAGSFKAFPLGELGGVIKFFLHNKGFNAPQISIPHHKMFVARDGHADKKKVIACLESRFNIIEKNDNIADAISMALLYSAYLKHKAGCPPEAIYDKILMLKMETRIDVKPKQKPESKRKRKTAESASADADAVQRKGKRNKRGSNKAE